MRWRRRWSRAGKERIVGAAIELAGLLWRAELRKPAFARVDTQLAEQGPHADGADDVVLTQSLERWCDLVTEEGGHLTCPDIDECDGSFSKSQSSAAARIFGSGDSTSW